MLVEIKGIIYSKINKQPITIEEGERRAGDSSMLVSDVSKLNDLLNWQPKVTLQEGVKKLLDNIDYWKDAPVWDEKSISAATKKWFDYLD